MPTVLVALAWRGVEFAGVRRFRSANGRHEVVEAQPRHLAA